MQPYGALYCFGWRSEGDWGERREAGIQWIQPPKAVIDPEFRQTPSGAHGSAGRADCLPRGKPPASMTRDNFAVRNFPLRGIDAPTPAWKKGLQPYGALTLFFRWRKKSVQKKASGTATTGKSPLLPIFERGSSQCRAQHSWTANIYVRARSCSLFSSFKKGKAFSLRCLSPLCSPAVGVGQAYSLRVGKFQCGLGIFAAWMNRLLFFSPQLATGILTPCGVGCFGVAQRKRPAGFQIHAGLCSEP